jgi:hypothetical protein
MSNNGVAKKGERDMKKTVKINYRNHEMRIIPTRECGIETWLTYVGTDKVGSALSETAAISIGKNYINRSVL